MTIHKLSRQIVAHRNRLQQLADANGHGDIQLAAEEVTGLIEELTATNEELHSVNRQLEDKNKALAQLNIVLQSLNTDLKHLVENVDVAVLFVNRDLRVTRFTPAITRIFPLHQSDCGRRLTDFTNKLRAIDMAAELTTVLRTGTDIEREVRFEADQKSHTALMRVRPYRLTDGTVDGMILSFFDIDAISLAAHAEMARYTALARASGDAILGLSLDGIVNAWSPGAERLLGCTADEMVGKHISILAPEGFATEQRALLEQAGSGKQVAPYDALRRHKDGTLVQVSIRAAPILTPEATPIGISETMRDIAERKRSEERNTLLTRELAHRTRNLLSLVHSTMLQTAQYSPDKQSFIQSVDDRLRSMAQAQDLLIANNFKGAWVEDLIRSCLKPFLINDAALQMHGPPISLKADVVHNLSLVLHELATNALKYGALTEPQGKIIVSWELDGGDVNSARFQMSWQETDGPAVVPPRQAGFGTEVISKAPKHELDAEVSLEYKPAGLRWSLDMLASRAVEELSQ